MGKHFSVLILNGIFLMTGFVQSTTETQVIIGDCQNTTSVKIDGCTRLNTPLPRKYFPCKDGHCLYLFFKRISAFTGNQEHACNLVYPTCHNDTLQVPCRQYCKEGFDKVGGNKFFEDVCDLLPESPCYSHHTHTPPIKYNLEHNCKKHTICDGTGFDYTDLNNLKRKSQRLPWGTINKCSDPFLAKFYICGFKFPHCITNVGHDVLPCFDYCDELMKICPFIKVDCDNLYLARKAWENPCFDPTSGPNFSLKRTTKAIKNAIAPVKPAIFCPFPEKPQICGSCDTFRHDLCTQFGYHKTFIIKSGQTVEKSPSQNFDSMREIINSTCHPDVSFFFCSLYFPYCNNNSLLKPCSGLCEEIKLSCSLNLTCDEISNREPNCTASSPKRDRNQGCHTNEFKCRNTGMCIPRHLTCNTINDCDDWSDETSCRCDPVSQWKCDNGMCIQKSQRCDGIYNCPDQSDEKEPCECKHNQLKCRNSSKCYMEQWICDGQKDCPYGEDEANCTCASKDDWRCVNGDCIPRFQKCDGKAHCADHSDEMKCLSIDGEDNTLLVNTEENVMMKLCFIGFAEVHAKEACRKLGQGPLRSLSHINDTSKEKKIMLHNLGATSTTLGQGNIVKDCIFNMTVVLECHPKISTDGVGNTLLLSTVNEGVMQVCFEGFCESYAKAACQQLGQGVLQSFSPFEGTSNYSKFVLSPLEDVETILGSGRIVSACTKNMLVRLKCRSYTCERSKIPVPPANIESSTYLKWPWIAYIIFKSASICVATIINEVLLYTSADCVRHINIKDLENLNVITGTKYKHLMHQMSDRVERTIKQYKVHKIIVQPQYTATKTTTDHDVALVLLKGSIQFNEKTKPLCGQNPHDVFSKASDCFIAGWGQSWCKMKKDHLRHRKLTLWDAKKCNSSLLLNGTLGPNEGCAEFYNGFVAIGKFDSGSPIFCNDEYGTFKLVGIAPTIKDDCLETTIIKFSVVQDIMPWINRELAEAVVFVCDNKRQIYQPELLCNNEDDCGDRSDEMNKHCDVSFNCSFDGDFLCGYYFKSGYDRRPNPSNKHVTKDPLFDHTKGLSTGHWIHPDREMLSPIMNLSEHRCARFYYNLRGYAKEGFAVYRYDGKRMEKKWDVNGTFLLDTWMMVMFDVPPGLFQMIVVSYNSDFSIDDTMLLKGSCASVCVKGEFKCFLQQKIICLPEALKCNIVADCDGAFDEKNCNYIDRHFTCTFDNGKLCGLMQSATISESWKLLPPTHTEKFQDHNKRYKEVSGALLSVDADYLGENEAVILRQYLHLKNHPHCLKFFYKSNVHATFQIYLLSKDNNILYFQQAYKKQMPHKWRLISANIPANLDRATLFYEVVKTKESRNPSSIQIEYITIVRGECKKPSDTDPEMAKTVWAQKVCTRNETKCENGNCIAKSKNCDGKKDCPDGLDEGKICKDKRKVTCFFKDNFLCGYTPLPIENDTIAKTASLLTFKKIDKKLTKLTSFAFTYINRSLIITYYAYNPKAKENNGGYLSVYNVAKNSHLLWSTNATSSKAWRTDCFTLPNERTRLSFEPTDATEGRMTFCIDHVALSKDPCRERV